jgi:hypothetical protein
LAQANGIPHSVWDSFPRKSLRLLDLCESALIGKLTLPGQFFAAGSPNLEHFRRGPDPHPAIPSHYSQPAH